MRGFCSCIVLLLAAVQGTAQVELKWKWKQDDTFFVQTVTKVKQNLVVEDSRSDTLLWRIRGTVCLGPLSGSSCRSLAAASTLAAATTLMPRSADRDREIKQEYEHTSWVRFRVKKRNEDGSAVLVQSVPVPEPGKERGTVKGADVEKEDTTLGGLELTLHVDPRGEVTKVEGAAKVLERVAANETGKRQALDEALSEESLKASASQSLGVMPGKLTKIGDSWPRTVELKLGGLGRLKLERTFTLNSVTEKGVTKMAGVSFFTRIADYQPGQGQGFAFRIVEGNWAEAESKGNLDIDVDSGRPIGATSNLKLSGYLTMRNTEVSYRIRLTQEQTTTMKVTDRLPPKPEPMNEPFIRPMP
jgi:hypothetical protein